VRRAGNAERGLRDLVRLLLEHVPRVCLFVRAENEPAICLYEKIGMEHVLDYRSVLL
jgi:predicted GNAT family acetyltransferase